MKCKQEKLNLVCQYCEQEFDSNRVKKCPRKIQIQKIHAKYVQLLKSIKQRTLLRSMLENFMMEGGMSSKYLFKDKV